jgi:hypothetical protein
LSYALMNYNNNDADMESSGLWGLCYYSIAYR